MQKLTKKQKFTALYNKLTELNQEISQASALNIEGRYYRLLTEKDSMLTTIAIIYGLNQSDWYSIEIFLLNNI
jgi:hypothetical protein